MSDRLLDAANMLVNLGALVTSGGPLGGEAALKGLLSLGGLRAARPAAPDLAQVLARDMRQRLDAPGVREDQRALVPQMIEAALPDPAAIVAADLDAARLVAMMEARLTEREHMLPANIALFRAILMPALERLLADRAFVETLAPAWQRAILARLTEMADGQAALLAKYGTLAQAAEDAGRLRKAELLNLAFLFRLTPGPTATPAELVEMLQARAQEFTELQGQLEARRAEFPQLDNQITLAREKLVTGDTAGVRDMVRDARKALRDARLRAALEQDAGLAELDARALLLEHRVHEAFAVLSDAADSFAALDPLEPAQKRLDYEDLLFRHGLRHGGPGLALAERMLRAALERIDRTAAPALWAQAQAALGDSLQQQGSRTGGAQGAALLAEAVAAYRAALELRARADDPEGWAGTQNNLAVALQAQGSRTAGDAGAALLEQAIAAFGAALEVRTRDTHPDAWASTSNNLGIALQALAGRTGGAAGAALLEQAAAAWRAALQVRTRADRPGAWAQTQNNLAAVLVDQGSRARGALRAALLAQAEAACRAVIALRGRDDHPLDWAAAQTTLGRALALRTTGTWWVEPEDDLLIQALDVLAAAQTVFTRTDHPVGWAMTQRNIAEVLWLRAHENPERAAEPDLRAALAHLDAALEVFDAEHMGQGRRQVLALRARVVDDLDTPLDAD